MPMTRSPSIALVVAALALGPACGGSIGAYTDSVTGDQSLSHDGGADGAPLCGLADAARPEVPAICAKVMPRDCVTDMGPACSRQRFAATVTQVLLKCGAPCGEVLVAVTQGCVTDVGPAMRADAAATFDPLLECARLSLIGTAWTCLPPDGLIDVAFGVCLTP